MAKILFRLDLTGQRFGDWLVLRNSHKGRHGEIYWWCRDAVTSEEKAVRAGSLIAGLSQSSGHRHRAAVTTHGMTDTRTFKSWESMKQRCLNPKAPDFQRYGGRGIDVWPSWVNSFETFFADMGPRPERTTLDRIDVDGDYTPENCRWATPKRQQRNRRDTLMLTLDGATQSLPDWAEQLGVSRSTLKTRLDKGWTVERALRTPVQPRRIKSLQSRSEKEYRHVRPTSRG